MSLTLRNLATSVAMSVLLIAGCGGGGGSASTQQPGPQQPGPQQPGPQQPTPPPPMPGAPSNVIPVFAPKRMHLMWGPAADATSYKVMISADAQSEFRMVGLPVLSAQDGFDVPLAVHVLDWSSARYRVDACNVTGCTPSTSHTLNTFFALEALGYFKPGNIDAGDQFGFSTALSNNGLTLAVGAPLEDGSSHEDQVTSTDNSVQDAGAVYVFTRSSAGQLWQLKALLKAPNADANDRFGAKLALSADGTTLAVGAALEDSAATGVDGDSSDNSASAAGAAYVFRLVNGAWTPEAYLKASNTEAGDGFGSALALSADGNTLAVSAPEEDSSDDGIDGNQVANLAQDAGAVYLFSRQGTSWKQSSYVKSSNSGAGHFFGTAVALSHDGRTFVASAPGEGSGGTGVNGQQSSNSRPGSGAAYLFTFANSQWSQQAYFKASRAITDLEFGTALALSGDALTLAVGAPGENGKSANVDGDQDLASITRSGAVYVFINDSHDGWLQQSYIKAGNPDPSDEFGTTVALSEDGNALAVGAPLEDGGGIGIGANQLDNSALNAGAAYMYLRNAGQWQHGSYLKSGASTGADFFARSLALSADAQTLAIGTRDDSALPGALPTIELGSLAKDGAAVAAGSVYLY